VGVVVFGDSPESLEPVLVGIWCGGSGDLGSGCDGDGGDFGCLVVEREEIGGGVGEIDWGLLKGLLLRWLELLLRMLGLLRLWFELLLWLLELRRLRDCALRECELLDGELLRDGELSRDGELLRGSKLLRDGKLLLRKCELSLWLLGLLLRGFGLELKHCQRLRVRWG
jgi:hypothetical protein